MTAQIRANRPEVTDRFPMLGLTIRTDGPPQRAEVAIAIDPGLFRPERKADRKLTNFYSSRVGGPISVPRGEAIYIVPPEVLARFIGQDRIYVALATAPDSTGGATHVDVLPGEGSPYISLKNLTGRSMKRVRVLPSRQQRAAGYGGNGQKALEWAGDGAVPGMEQAPNSAAATPTTPAAGRGGNGKAADAPSTAPIPYDDGFMPPLPPRPSDQASPSTVPATPAAPAASAAAQSYARRTAPSLAQEELSADDFGIDGPIPDAEPTAVQAARAMDAPQQSEYPRASRFAPAHPSNYHVAGKPRSIDRIVIHITDGGSKIAGTIGWFQNPNQRNSRNQPIHVSAHYVVGQDGEVVQMVRNNDIAHHASQANTRSIGIEHVANSKGLMPTEAEYQASACLVAWLCAQLGIPADREHIVGHHAISPRDQHDDCPDAVWDWDHYMDLVQAAATSVGAQALWEGEPPKNQDWATSAKNFGWPASLDQGNYLVTAFVEAMNERVEHNVRGEPAPDPTQFVSFDPDAPARREALGRYIPQVGAALGSRDISEAILQVTTAVSMQVFDLIKDRLPATLQGPIAINPADLPRPSPDLTIPRALPFLSRQIGTFMAWVDIAVQKATADTAERLRLQKEQWEMMGAMVGAGFTALGLVPGLGTAATFIGLAAQAVIIAATPDFDRQYASFTAAMKAVRQTYKGLAAAVLKGLVAHKLGQDIEIIGLPLHPDVQSYLDAHTAYALKGWEEELAFLGYTGAGAEPAFSQARAAENGRRPVSRAMVVGLEDRQKARKYGPPFRELFQWATPKSVVREIEARGFKVQTIDAAIGDLNLDRYPVAISRFPEGWDAPRLLQYFIRNINQFVDSDLTEFIPYDESDAQRLASSNPKGTVFKLDIFGPDNAAIVISAAEPQFYIVTTINTPWSGDHPVSGHRQFGYIVEKDSTTTFYTRGADRATLGFPGTESAIFYGGEKLWESFQSKLAAFINDNGGAAKIIPPFSERFNATAMREEFGRFDVAKGLAVAQAMSRRQTLAGAQEIITPFYDPADPSTALTCQNDAFSLAREEWFVGVPNTTIFPHSAICQLRMTAPDGSGYIGTGFYIGSHRILTCAHNLAGMSSVKIIPGRNGAGNDPFGQCTVSSSSWRIASAYGGDGDWGNDLAVIDGVPLAAPNGQWFGFLNATPSDRLPIVVCGYSAASNAVPELTQAIDRDKQHLHGGYAPEQTNPEVIEYSILALKGNSGSPVYHVDTGGSEPQALVCAVHVTGEPAAQGLNRGCFITPAKIDWIEGRAKAFSLSSLALKISSKSGGMRKPQPPASRARALGSADTAAMIGGFPLGSIRGSSGNVTWELDQFANSKHPNDTAPENAAPYKDAATIKLDKWPASGPTASDTSAWFAIDWQYNGLSLGNVRISNIGTNNAAGCALSVRARIVDDSIVYQPGGCAALAISFCYRFSQADGADNIAITDVHLYGDGTYESRSYWMPSGMPAAAYGQGGGVDTAIAAVGTMISLVGGQSVSNPSWLQTAHPDGVAPPGRREWKQARMELKNVPKSSGPFDTMTAYFTVTWEYDGLSLRNIFFYPNVNTALVSDIEVSVHVIERDAVRTNANSPSVAAVDLQFNYRFIHKVDDDETAVHRVQIRGDGSSWQNPKPEWISAPEWHKMLEQQREAIWGARG
jgi:N-acetyl-anhydromuramyl-L-alanine amidase AmpD/V8-like Glu-specific endopeptidase